MEIFKRFVESVKKRATRVSDLEWELYRSNELNGIEGSYPTLYMDDTGSYLVYVDRGALYRVDVSVAGSKYNFSERKQVYIEHVGVERSNLFVERTEEGLRFACIAGTSVLNRSFELDSTLLFDSMVETFDDETEYKVNFYHNFDDEEQIMGEVISIERVGNVFVAYGIIDETTIYGREAYRNFQDQEEPWGISMEFIPTEVETMDVDGVEINTYTKGRFHGLAIVLERDASHFFTSIISEGQ